MNKVPQIYFPLDTELSSTYFASSQSASQAQSAEEERQPHVEEQPSQSSGAGPSSLAVHTGRMTTDLENEVQVLRQQVALLTQHRQWDEEEEDAPPQYEAS